MLKKVTAMPRETTSLEEPPDVWYEREIAVRDRVYKFHGRLLWHRRQPYLKLSSTFNFWQVALRSWWKRETGEDTEFGKDELIEFFDQWEIDNWEYAEKVEDVFDLFNGEAPPPQGVLS